MTVRAEGGDGARPLPLGPPLGLPLLGIMLATLLLDRWFGLTASAVTPQEGLALGLRSGQREALLADVVTVLVLAVVLLLIRLSGRPRAAGGMFVLLAVGSLVGLQLGSAAAEATTGRPVPTDLYLARGLFLAGTTVAASLVLARLAEHRGATQALRSATAQAEAQAAAGREGLALLRLDVAEQVREVLRDALEALAVSDGRGSGARLRSLSGEVLRPLSHRLAAVPVATAAARPPVTPVRWRDTFGVLLRTPVIPVRTLALLASGLAFLRTLVTDQDVVRDISPTIPPEAEGVGVGLSLDVAPFLTVMGELSAALLLTWWGGQLLASLLESRRSRWNPALLWVLTSFGVATVAAVSVIAPVGVERLTGIGEGVVGGAVVFVAALVPMLVVVAGTSLVAAVDRGRVQLEAELAREREAAVHSAARVQAVLSHEQRQLARRLHADVQATVNAAGLLLDRADREGTVTPGLVDEAAARIATSVERFLGGGVSRRALGPRLDEVRALWAGVCTVVIEADDVTAARIDADAVTHELVVDLVTEACANAVVHGGASRVDVRLAAVDDEVELEVVDDGTQRSPRPAERSSRPSGLRPSGGAWDGFGTEVLRASCTSFALEVAERGARLTARIPLARA